MLSRHFPDLRKKPLWLTGSLLILLFGYFLYSFIQHYHIPIMGDLSKIIVPADAYQAVLEHPFGLPALLDGKVYPAPNRFFAHASLYAYYRITPEMLQSLTGPVNSLYAATAIGKTAIQVFLTALLARFVLTSGTFWQWRSLAVMLLIAPLFQVNGYNLLIGVIDKSIAYTFFYAGGLLLTALFVLLFWKGLPSRDESFAWWRFGTGLILAVVLPFHGPLNAPVILLSIATILLIFWLKRWFTQPGQGFISSLWRAVRQIHPRAFTVLLVAGLMALYSIYIGQFNAENQSSTLPLWERYQRLPRGLLAMFGSKPGPAMLVGLIGLNSLLIWRFGDQHFRCWYGRVLLAAGVLFLIYTLLLPLGGYRDYRPLIIRRDTYAPVLLGLFYLHGLSSYYLLGHWKGGFYRAGYALLIAVFLGIFLEHDKLTGDNNKTEKYGIQQIRKAQKDTVALSVSRPVLAWGRFEDPQRSAVKTEALQIMGILQEDKLYYHDKE